VILIDALQRYPSVFMILALANLEPGDRFDGGAGDLGEDLVAIVDSEGVVGGLRR
jgi:hypothetical protein